MKKSFLRFVSFVLSLVMFAAAVPVMPVEGLTDFQIFHYETGAASENGYAPLMLMDESGNETSLDEIARNNSVDFISTMSADDYALPEKYDSRDFGFITSVKTQQASTCWAHAATACLEASYLRQGLTGISNPDFSEMHLAWSFYMQKTDDTSDPTYGDGSNQPSIPLEQGGNEQSAFSALARWSGAATQKDYPQKSTAYMSKNYYANNMTNDDRYASVLHLENYIELPNSVHEIKQAILDYGAVCVSYSSMGTDYPYYYPEGSIDHSVIIVGWDDNYGADKFSENCRPASDGVWLCKNSWGVRQGENGYFRMSYDQTPLSKFFVYTADADFYDNNYQYCGSTPSFYSVTGNSPVMSANVFTAKSKETLEAVGVYLPLKNSEYKIEIYTGLPTVNSDPVSGGTLESVITGTKEHSGYYTLELDKPVLLEEGERFSVVLSAETSWTSKGFIAIGNAYYEHYETGRGFIYKSGTWRDSAKLISNDVYIRAFTYSVSPEVTYNVDFTGCNGEKITSSETDVNGSVELPSAPEGYEYEFMFNGARFTGRGIKTDTEITVHKTKLQAENINGCTVSSVCDYCGEHFNDIPNHNFDETVIFDWKCKRTEKHCERCGHYETDFDFPVGSYNGLAGEHSAWYIDPVTGDFCVVGRGEATNSLTSAAAEVYGWKDYVGSIRNCYVGNEITSLPLNFLNGATFLKSVEILGDITEIPSYAFSGCIQLSYFNIPESVVRINNNSFSNSGLKNIFIPDSVEYIGKQAFFGCNKLESISGLDNIKKIDDQAFMNTTLTGTVYLPESISYIGDGAFSVTHGLEGVEISPACKYYTSYDGKYILTNDGKKLVYYSSYADDIVFAVPDGVKSIGAYAFIDNINLRYIELPDVTDVGVFAFQNTKLNGVGFGSDENITLKNSAFKGSVEILSMYLPASVTVLELYSVGFNNMSNVNKAFTVFCESGSAAEKYASTYGVKCSTDHTEHSSEHIALVEATCLNDGIGYKLCTVCGHVSDANEVYSVNGEHTYRWEYDVEPECEKSGIKHGICVHCGFKGEENTYVPENGHDYCWVKDVSETCDTKGIMHEECSSCGYIRSENTEIPASGHTFSWVIDVEMTCGDDGIKHEECTVCGFVQSINTPIPSTHQHSTLKTNWCGCRPYGLIRGSKICIDCGTAVSGDEVIIKSTPHVYERVTTVEPTCTRKGEERDVCKYCFDVKETVYYIPMRHTYEYKTVIDATCSTYGVQKKLCIHCGQEYVGDEKTIPKNNVHAYEWVTDTEASCVSNGCKHQVCTDCGAVTSENTVVKAYGHDYVWITDKPETCTESGLKHQQCSTCGDCISVNTVIPFCEHSYVWVTDVEPSCGFNGIRHSECTECGHVINENTPISLTGNHSYVWITDREADCRNEGYKHLYCSECNSVSMRNTVIPVTSHVSGDFEYSGNGVFEKRCLNCDFVFESENVYLSFAESDIQVNNTEELYLVPEISAPFELNIIYTSSDKKVLSVNSDGWAVAVGPGKSVVTATVEGSDITASVIVTVLPRKFTAEWNINGEVISQYVNEGEKLVPPSVSESEGLYFAGWSPSLQQYMPSHDVIYTALFKKYDVSRIKLKIIEPSDITLHYGESITLYADVSCMPENSIIKWYTEGKGVKIKPSETGRMCTVTSVSTGDAVIHAYVAEKGGVPILNLEGNRITDSQPVKSDANPWYIILFFIKKIFSIRF